MKWEEVDNQDKSAIKNKRADSFKRLKTRQAPHGSYSRS